MELSFSSCEDNSDVLFCKGKKVDRFRNPEKFIFCHWLVPPSACLSGGKCALRFIESWCEARFLRAGTGSCIAEPAPRGIPGRLGVGHSRCRALCVSRPVVLMASNARDPLLQCPIPTAQNQGRPWEPVFLHLVPDLTLLKL